MFNQLIDNRILSLQSFKSCLVNITCITRLHTEKYHETSTNFPRKQMWQLQWLLFIMGIIFYHVCVRCECGFITLRRMAREFECSKLKLYVLHFERFVGNFRGIILFVFAHRKNIFSCSIILEFWISLYKGARYWKVVLSIFNRE